MPKYVMIHRRLPSAEDYPDIFLIDPTMPPRERLDILLDLIMDDAKKPEIIGLSMGIVEAAVANGSAHQHNPISQLQALLDWQATYVRYQEDPTDPDGWQTELFKRASRAISDSEDDCEGKTTVYCTMATSIGFPSYADWLEQRESRNNHVAPRSLVPARWARTLPAAGPYDVDVISPTDPPRIDGYVPIWSETTLAAVKTPRGVVPGPRVGEHPYAVLARYRAAGVARLGL